MSAKSKTIAAIAKSKTKTSQSRRDLRYSSLIENISDALISSGIQFNITELIQDSAARTYSRRKR